MGTPGADRRFSMVPTLAASDPRVSGEALRVLVLLCRYADRDGRCWPSNQTLADMLRVTPRTIQHHLESLRRSGYVVTEHPRNDPSAGRSAVVIVGRSEARTARTTGPEGTSTDDMGTSTVDVGGTSTDDMGTSTGNTGGTSTADVGVRQRVTPPIELDQRTKFASDATRAGTCAREDRNRNGQKPNAGPDSPEGHADRVGSLEVLAVELWGKPAAAEIREFAASEADLDAVAMEYAIRSTAADRDRKGMTVHSPRGFILREYRKFKGRSLPAGPVGPRAKAEPARPRPAEKPFTPEQVAAAQRHLMDTIINPKTGKRLSEV